MFCVSRGPMCEKIEKSTKKLDKRNTGATCIKNKANQGSVVGESYLTCHCTQENLGLRENSPKSDGCSS